MSEWIKEAVLKTVGRNSSVGSNPTATAKHYLVADFSSCPKDPGIDEWIAQQISSAFAKAIDKEIMSLVRCSLLEEELF